MNINLDFITNYTLVLLGCLGMGYVLKHWIADIDNKYIPTIMLVLGAVIACISKSTVTLEHIIYGAITGLASTGMHQMFKNLIERKEETE